jgi:hypothetical protein
MDFNDVVGAGLKATNALGNAQVLAVLVRVSCSVCSGRLSDGGDDHCLSFRRGPTRAQIRVRSAHLPV